MAAKKTASTTQPQTTKPAKKTLSISIPSRFSQQQILYTLLLVAVFLVGYLIATVQALKNPSATPAPAAGAQQDGTQAAAPTFTNDDIKAWAKEAGLNTNDFNSCFDSGKHNARIDEDAAYGQTVGVSGTPTFFINGVQLVGAQPFDAFKTAIDAAIAGTATGATTEVENGELPVLGDANAPVTIVEFSDLECPFCKQFVDGAYPQIKSEYIDTGKVKLYFRHYPLPFHPMAKPFALAVECANDQGKLWEMHDLIFSKQ